MVRTYKPRVKKDDVIAMLKQKNKELKQIIIWFGLGITINLITIIVYVAKHAK